MTKEKFLKPENFLIFVAILFAVGFAIRLGADYYQYTLQVNSAPFSAAVLFRSIEFLLPGAICVGISVFLRKRKAAK